MPWPMARSQLQAWMSPHQSHCLLTTPCCPSRTAVSVWGVVTPLLQQVLPWRPSDRCDRDPWSPLVCWWQWAPEHRTGGSGIFGWATVQCRELLGGVETHQHDVKQAWELF